MCKPEGLSSNLQHPRVCFVGVLAHLRQHLGSEDRGSLRQDVESERSGHSEEP